MKIHILRQRASENQILEMLKELQTYIKLAVDVERAVLAGGGEYHADFWTDVGTPQRLAELDATLK